MPELTSLVAKRFIQRRDVKAIQLPDARGTLNAGDYIPDRAFKRLPDEWAPTGFKGRHIEAHINGKASFGHYLLDENSMCRVMAFDIDLEKAGSWVDIFEKDAYGEPIEPVIHECNPREVWADRKQKQARAWFKMQMNLLAHKFAKAIIEELNLPCAAAYSGSKGVHVYGFMPPSPAYQVREGALLAVDVIGEFEASRGNNFFKHTEPDPVRGFPSFSVEVFPKQHDLEGKDLGNLMRLPLGRNFKNPKDPTFFLDLRAPLANLSPHPDPVRLLETGNPYL